MTLDSEDHRSPEMPVAETSVLALDLRRTEDPVWSGWDVLLIAVVSVFAIIVCSVAALAIGIHYLGLQGSPQSYAQDSRIVIPVQVVAYGIVISFMYLLVRRLHGRGFWRELQWNWPAIAIAAAYLAGGILLAAVVQLASAALPIPKSLPIEKFFKDPTSAYLMAAFGITVAPLLEELFFRGFMYPVLARRTGVWPAVVITAIAFALLHQSQLGYAWAPLLLLFLVGFALTLTRARTYSVANSFLMHVGYNFALFALLWVSSDHFRNLEKAMQ